MALKEFNLNYLSDNIEIRSLTNYDLEININWFRTFMTLEGHKDNMSDDALKEFIAKYVIIDKLFLISRIFVILKDNKFIGSFYIVTNNDMKFKEKDYNKKNIFGYYISLVDGLNNDIVDICIEKSIEALKYFKKYKINTIYSRKIYHKKLYDNFINNEFKELEIGNYYLKPKWEKYIKKHGFVDQFKVSNILVKKIL